MPHTFTFICQQGELEIKAALLAASLHYFVQGEVEFVAAYPTPESHWGQPSADTVAFLHSLGVRLVAIENPISLDYPIGNKLACLDLATQAEQITFLDSDMLCLQAFKPEQSFKSGRFYAKPADLATFTEQVALWTQLYQMFNLPLPQWRVLTTVSRQLSWPYFNAGMISVPTHSDLPQLWRHYCQQIEADPSIPNKRPWLDQIGLPLALAKSGLPHECLDERFNYPLHLKPLSNALPVLCHYHWPSVIRREPRLLNHLHALLKHYPALTHLLQRDSIWATLLQPYQQIAEKKRGWTKKQTEFNLTQPVGIITGLPRSGTSYLCRLLHQLPNSVVINEPTSIFPALQAPFTPWGLKIYHQELRRDILDGQPVENKMKDGQLVEDTAHCDERVPYLPTVKRPDFALFTKNTLAYMARLPQIRVVMPEALIIACIRHPIDTLISWQHSFPHLEHADVTHFPIGSPTDPHLTQLQQQRLQAMAEVMDLRIRRAMLWTFLAEQILAMQEEMYIVPYEQMVQNPKFYLKAIWQRLPNAPRLSLPSTIQPSSPRYKRDKLSPDEQQIIHDICGEVAYQLGYDLTRS